MGLKCYFEVKKFVGQLNNVPKLNMAIEYIMEVDPHPDYHGFVQVANGKIQFWQGSAGEDSSDEYGNNSSYRTYGEQELMCELLSRHLVEGGNIRIMVDNEGNDNDYYDIIPGAWKKFDPFA